MRRGMLKPLLCLIVLSIVSFLPQPEIHASELPSLQWKNLRSEYSNPQDLKPIILNQGNRSIYVNPMSPLADVERLNESLNRWELCLRPGFCFNGVRLDLANEIKPGEEMHIQPDWPYFFSIYHKDAKASVFPDKRNLSSKPEERPLVGRYRLVLRYTFVPWVNTFNPDPVFTVESPEFRME
jgi:hypothetical protein